MHLNLFKMKFSRPLENIHKKIHDNAHGKIYCDRFWGKGVGCGGNSPYK